MLKPQLLFVVLYMIVISKTFRVIQFKNPRKLHEVEFFNAKAFHIFWPLKFNRIQIDVYHITQRLDFRFMVYQVL